MLLSVANQIRVAENNDWVIFTLLGCIALYLVLMNVFLRDSTLKEFFTIDYASSANRFVSWIIVSFVFCLTLSVLLSQYIPIIPYSFSKIGLFGIVLNKFGFTFLAVVIFYLFKCVLGYVFYLSTGHAKRWNFFYFANTRFYFGFSLLLMMLCVMHYYFPIDRELFFLVYIGLLLVGLIFKLLYYWFHRNNILPQEWYYKFLYICTLQIVPVFALWNILFL